MFAKVQLATGGSWHGTSGVTGIWTFYQRRVVPGLGWMVLDLSRVMLLDHIPGALGVHGLPPRGGTLVK